jgi:hypothetical protein
MMGFKGGKKNDAKGGLAGAGFGAKMTKMTQK